MTLDGSYGGASTWLDLENRRGQVESQRENATRPSRAWATYKSTGAGYKIEEACFKFEGSFVPDQLPIFHFGVVLDPDGADLPTDDPPRCTAGVYDWKRTAQEFYAGAYCWFVVDTFTTVTDLRLIWTLSWEGVASKDFISTPGFPVNTLDV